MLQYEDGMEIKYPIRGILQNYLTENEEKEDPVFQFIPASKVKDFIQEDWWLVQIRIEYLPRYLKRDLWYSKIVSGDMDYLIEMQPAIFLEFVSEFKEHQFFSKKEEKKCIERESQLSPLFRELLSC